MMTRFRQFIVQSIRRFLWICSHSIQQQLFSIGANVQLYLGKRLISASISITKGNRLWLVICRVSHPLKGLTDQRTDRQPMPTRSQFPLFWSPKTCMARMVRRVQVIEHKYCKYARLSLKITSLSKAGCLSPTSTTATAPETVFRIVGSNGQSEELASSD